MHVRVAFYPALALLILGSAAPARAAKIDAVTLEPGALRTGTVMQVRVELDQAYDNPFDPEQIAVDAELTGPDGVTVKIPGFWTQAVARSLEQGREKLTLQGEPAFAIRVLPLAAGMHTLKVTATDAAGTGAAPPLTVGVEASATQGLVRVDPRDPLSLMYDDGSAYVPIGANVDWSVEPSGSYDIDDYYARMQAAGMNWSRLWLTHFGEGWTLEWGDWHPSGYYHGLGRYSLEVAARLDHVLEEAEARGIRLQLVLWQHGQFETSQWSSWPDNPYNAVHGGPASTSAQFFTSAEALRLSRQKLRYLVARYSAFPSLLAWEMMNEMDGVQAPLSLVVGWCDQRARDTRALDPYRHLVTTSYMIRPGFGKLAGFESDAYDLAQAHNYWGTTVSLPADAKGLLAYGKPRILGEYGLNASGEDDLLDIAGHHLWDGSWVALASGFQGGAMSWWWDNYLRPNDLFKTQWPLARVLQQVDLRGVHQQLTEDGALAVDNTGESLGVYGRRNAEHVFALVRHSGCYWKTAQANQGLPDVAGGQLSVTGAAKASWNVRMFDSLTGELAGTGEAQADDQGVVRFVLPAFKGALVLDLRSRTDQPALSLEPSGGCAVSSSGGTAGWLAVLALLLRRR
jgi:hypothetical protein